MTGSAMQTQSAWVGAGLTELQPGSGVPSQDSSATEAGYGQPAYLWQPHQSGQAHVYPPPRIDERVGSTSVLVPVLYWDQSIGTSSLSPKYCVGPVTVPFYT